MKRWWIVVALLALFPGSSATASGRSPSAVLQLEFREWSSWLPRSADANPWVTRIVRVSAGDTLGDFPPSWWDEKGPVFRVVRVEGPDRVWVRFHPSVPPTAPRLAGATAESVLVTTVRRSFSTRSYDAGLNYYLTVIDSTLTRSPSLTIEKTDKRMLGWNDLDQAVWSMALVAIGQVVGFAENPLERSPANGMLTFVVEESWRGAAAAGDTIEVVGPLRLTNGQMYVPVFTTPIMRGDRVLLFLQPADQGASRRRMKLWHSGLMAQQEMLVFEPMYLGKGVPLDSCRVRVGRSVAELHAPYTGRFTGRILDHDSGLPVPGASVRDVSTRVSVATDDSGRFEIRGLPIGQRHMEVTAACYTTLAGLVPISDETANELWIPIQRRRSGGDCK